MGWAYGLRRKALLLTCIFACASLFLLQSFRASTSYNASLHRLLVQSTVHDAAVSTHAYLAAHSYGKGNYTSKLAIGNKESAAHATYFPNTTNLIHGDDLHVDVALCSSDIQLNERKFLSWKKGGVTQFKPMLPCNCTKLISGDEREISSVQESLKQWHRNPRFVAQLRDWSPYGSNCAEITAKFHNSFYISREERDFPLAFSFVSYERTGQIVRLLKAIYRPHNVYCFHPDGKSNTEFVRRFRYLTHCLDNIIMPQELGEVFYAHHSIMDAQMTCMRELARSEVRQKFRWKYVINVCGTELPLRTNREMVQALEPLYNQGLSAIEPKAMNSEGFSRFHHKYSLNRTTGKMMETDIPMGKPPHNIILRKSWNFIAATQSFVDFLLHSRVASDFREWIKDGLIPEEHFYSSLYYHTHTYPLLSTGHQSYPSVTIYQWMNIQPARENPRKFCRGVTVHSVCIQTSADLARIYETALAEGQRTYFFFNKYFMDRDHVVMDCMEKRLVEQNRREFVEDCRT